jgi:F-type H+-transporting ATPase subunit delta
MASNNNDQTNGPVGAVYAKALFELADESGRLAEVNDEIEQFEEVLAMNPELMVLLASRTLSKQERALAIDRIFKGRISDALLHFLHVVNQKNRLGSLRAIIRQFGKLIDERHKVVEVDAYVASRLDEAMADRVSHGIGQAIGSNVLLHQYVEPQLLGGLKIRVGDRLFDGSVATQLKLIRQKLTQAGREKARLAAME